MTRTKRIILFTIVFLLLFFLIQIIRVGLNTPSYYGDVGDAGTGTTITPTKYNNNLNVCGWIPEWAPVDGLASIKYNLNELDCISPVMYDLQADGTVKNVARASNKAIIDTAKANKIKIYPTVILFDHEIFSKILENETNYQKYMTQMIAIADNPDFDGIDLDYESTKLRNKDKYNEMIITLSNELHKRNKKLIVTVLSKWGDDVAYASLKETRQVQDWTFLGTYADQIRIMAYDYTYSKSTTPGPIGPDFWIEKILAYAKTKLPDEKIVLGIHLYSYRWRSTGDSKLTTDQMPFVFAYDYSTNAYDEKADVSSFDYETVQKIIRENKGSNMTFASEPIFIYQKFNAETNLYENNVLVYMDQAGVLARKKLAASVNAYGVCFWRLGKEGNLLKDI